MLWMCTTRFDLQEQKRLILQEYLSYQEIAAATEANESWDESFDPISDTEEDDIQPQNRESLPQSCTTMLDLEGMEAMDYEFMMRMMMMMLTCLCLIPSSVYLVESVSAQSYLMATYLGLNN